MWAKQILLAIIGLSSGMIVAGGLFAFISELGVISDMADRTHTGEHLLLYENAVMAGGALANVFFLFRTPIPYAVWILPLFGLAAGVFTGCWAMALAEMLDVFPVFVRRTKSMECVPWAILGAALGKGAGSLLFYYRGWGK